MVVAEAGEREVPPLALSMSMSTHRLQIAAVVLLFLVLFLVRLLFVPLPLLFLHSSVFLFRSSHLCRLPIDTSSVFRRFLLRLLLPPDPHRYASYPMAYRVLSADYLPFPR